MSDIDIRFFLVFLAPTLGFAVWFGKRWMEDRREQTRLKAAQDNLVRALYAEIDFNTYDMNVFLQKSPSQSVLREKLAADTQLVPHITDARHTEIYRNKINEVHSISDGSLQLTVHFYGLLEKIRVQIDGINLPSYRTLSLEGRLNAVDVIRRTAKEAELCGDLLLRKLESDHFELKLERFDRPSDRLSIEELSDRAIALQARLEAFKAKQAGQR